jgi:hypothetical protein
MNTTKIAIAMKNSHFAMVAAVSATPLNPSGDQRYG